jgi:hypothetical protein
LLWLFIADNHYVPKDLPGFIKHLQLDPKQKFGPIEDGEPVQVFRKHHVLCAEFNAMLDEGVHQDNVVPTLKRWSQMIEKDFYTWNFAYLPGNHVVAVIGELDSVQRIIITSAEHNYHNDSF